MLDAWDTTIKDNAKWGIWSGYGAILDLGNVTIRGHQSGLHLVDKVSASVNNVTIENNQWTGANTGNVVDDNVFLALGSTLHFQGSASDLEQVNCANGTDNVSGTVYNMPISYLFEHGNTGLALQSIREDGSGNKRTNCPVFGWGEVEPRLE
ncbi:MAG: hypothetical protein OSB18_08990 [SAR324 cluster bacterium]|nr:hypothetical protein [SAR324 cluster bacterium]